MAGGPDAGADPGQKLLPPGPGPAFLYEDAPLAPPFQNVGVWQADSTISVRRLATRPPGRTQVQRFIALVGACITRPIRLPTPSTQLICWSSVFAKTAIS